MGKGFPIVAILEGFWPLGFIAAGVAAYFRLTLDASVFEAIRAGIRKDRPTAMLAFIHNFYNYDVLGGKLVSERVVEEIEALEEKCNDV
jgi:hypothetical protein